MTRIGDPVVTQQLNDLLGSELGRNARGKSIFSWRWSEDMFWPARDTGRRTVNEKKIEIPIIGAPRDTHDFQSDGISLDVDFGTGKSVYPCTICGNPESDLGHTVYSIEQTPVPVYDRDAMTRHKACWLVAKWMSPEELIIGGMIGHGMGWQGGHKPTLQALVTEWNRIYPGAEFPALGWRIPTNARLPRGPQDPDIPNLEDTQHFIRQVREQTSLKFDDRLKLLYAEEDMRDMRDRNIIGDEIRDGFNAFLNVKPGSRGRGAGGGFVSMPWSKKDRQR